MGIMSRAPHRTRTDDRRFTKAVLYPTELERQAPQPGFEPGTNRLTVDSSTAELLWNKYFVMYFSMTIGTE
jgi:hypothetical protein